MADIQLSGDTSGKKTLLCSCSMRITEVCAVLHNMLRTTARCARTIPVSSRDKRDTMLKKLIPDK